MYKEKAWEIGGALSLLRFPNLFMFNFLITQSIVLGRNFKYWADIFEASSGKLNLNSLFDKDVNIGSQQAQRESDPALLRAQWGSGPVLHL